MVAYQKGTQLCTVLRGISEGDAVVHGVTGHIRRGRSRARCYSAYQKGTQSCTVLRGISEGDAVVHGATGHIRRGRSRARCYGAYQKGAQSCTVLQGISEGDTVVHSATGHIRRGRSRAQCYGAYQKGTQSCTVLRGISEGDAVVHSATGNVDRSYFQSNEFSIIFLPDTPVSSTNKTDPNDITEILLTVALNTIAIGFRGRAHVGGRFGRRSRLVAAHFALYQCQKRSGSRPVNLPSRFANFNSKTSVYFYYKISVFQTAILKGRNRNSYEYKNCIYGSVLGENNVGK